MKIVYRISDGGYQKVKPDYVTKRGCFLHTCKVFSDYDMHVIADNCGDETMELLRQHIPTENIVRTSLGNAKSFLHCVKYAIQKFKPSDTVFFCEDDYIFLPIAPKVLEEGLAISEYVTGYDHPDKYRNPEGGGNPQVTNGGEATRVVLTKSRHWKETNSTCMTFATHINVLLEDFAVYEKHCETHHPNDYHMFCDLKTSKSRRLISPLPSICTHGESLHLAPLIDWHTVFHSSM